MPDDAPDVPDDAPDVPDDAPDVPDDAPDVPDDVPDDAPDVPDDAPDDSPEVKEIEVGSKVKWTNNKGVELTGEVIKITPKSYKICCKPGKNIGDKGAIYMIKKEDVQLD